MPRVGGFQSFHTARQSIQGFEAMLWLRKGEVIQGSAVPKAWWMDHEGFGFAGAWTVHEQNRLLGFCFGLSEVNKA